MFYYKNLLNPTKGKLISMFYGCIWIKAWAWKEGQNFTLYNYFRMLDCYLPVYF